MLKWLKISFCLVSGLLVLVAGSGFSLAKMVCLKSGYTEIYLGQAEECCGDEDCGDNAGIESKCCDITSFNVESFRFLNSSVQQIEKSNCSIEIPAINVPDLRLISAEYHYSVNIGFDPPELTYPPVRIFTKSFLI